MEKDRQTNKIRITQQFYDILFESSFDASVTIKDWACPVAETKMKTSIGWQSDLRINNY